MKHSKESIVFEILANTDAKGLDKCPGGDCPTVYEAGDGDLLIQGYKAADLFESTHLPDGETVVRIPRGLLQQLISNHTI